MGFVAINAEGQSDGSANYLRKDDQSAVEHQPATAKGP
jgi:hypothetical protein